LAFAAGASGNFTITIEREDAAADEEGAIVLRFYVGSIRDGAFAPAYEFVLTDTPDRRPPTGPWPTDVSPALAVLAGALLTAFAALLLAPSRRLARVCPACEHKAPRFDTFMNPSCTECGETLALRKGAKR
jgi:hypothetical protein